MYFGISQFSQRLNSLPEADDSHDAADLNDVSVSENYCKCSIFTSTMNRTFERE